MTVHQRDHDQFKPVARPNVRLHGLGIMNAMQGVRLDPVTTTDERKSIENGILRLRGLSEDDAEAARNGGRHIKLQRFRATAEHTRAAGPSLRADVPASARRGGPAPSGPLPAVFARASGSADGPRLQPDPGRRPRGQNAAGPFAYKCPAGCGAITEYAAKPEPLQPRGWPKHQCHVCLQVARIGRSICVYCGRVLSRCVCDKVGRQARLDFGSGRRAAEHPGSVAG